MLDIIISAITCAVILLLIGGLTIYVEDKSDRWPPFIRYLIALPYALMGGAIATLGALILLIIQRFFIPLGEFEENVLWFEVIIVPAAYSYFFYKYLAILPKYYLVISSTIATLMTLLKILILIISGGATDLYIADVITNLFYSETIPKENFHIMYIVQFISSLIGTILSIYSANKRD